MEDTSGLKGLNNNSSGKMITAYLERDGITAEMLAEKAGIKQLWRVNNFLAGEMSIPLKNAWALARKYGKLTHEMYADYKLDYWASYNFETERIKTLPKLRADRIPEPLDVMLVLNKMTKAELARHVNVKRPHMTNVSNHRYIPSLKLALKIAKELNATVELLFYWIWEV